ncbi:MAG: MATE family efflux transporter [Candidatus Obscuribacterales bacterium]|nr:MATE family efflux transporter [Candidatus Obscuribacterales bacterium]
MYSLIRLNPFLLWFCGFIFLAKKKLDRLRKISRVVLAPAIPMAIALWFSALIGLSDAYLAGKMSNTALAALGFCEPLWFLVTLLTTGLCSGIAVGLAAKCSRDHIQKDGASQFFLVDSLIICAAVGLLLLCGALILSVILSAHPFWLSRTAQLVADYFLVCALSNLPFAIMQGQCAIFRAAGRGNNVVLLWGVAASIEIVASNLLVDVGFLNLTVLAVTWTVACSVSAWIGFILMKPLLQNFDRRAYCRSNWSAHVTTVHAVLSVGLPVAVGELGLICGSMLNLYVISTLPGAHNLEAAWAIKSRLEEAFEVVPICAIGLIIAPFMGWHHGVRSKRVANWAARISFQAAMTAGCALLMIVILIQFASRFLAGFFCVDSLLLEQTAQVISLASLAWPFFAVTYILSGALEGVRQTLIPTALHIIFALPVRLGLAIVLKDCPQFSGLTGVTIAGVVAQALLAIAIVAVFRRTFFKCLARLTV